MLAGAMASLKALEECLSHVLLQQLVHAAAVLTSGSVAQGFPGCLHSPSVSLVSHLLKQTQDMFDLSLL